LIINPSLDCEVKRGLLKKKIGNRYMAKEEKKNGIVYLLTNP
jgi:hypothetical protein